MGLGSLSPSYSSGRDIAMTAGGVRFSFSAEDFASRTASAAVRLGLVERRRLGSDELADLVALAAHGAIAEPASELAPRLDALSTTRPEGEPGPAHWLRRLVFRGAWIDQQVADGVLQPVFEEEHGFRYRSSATGEPAAPESPVPDWSALMRAGPGDAA